MDIKPVDSNQLLQGCTLVSACKDRNYNLGLSFNSWKHVVGLDEIIIVDWSSKDPVLDLVLKEQGDIPSMQAVSVIRVSGFEEKWVLTWAFNLGMCLADNRTVYKIDADIVLRDRFIFTNPIQEGQFMAGNWKHASRDNPDELHLNGQCGFLLDDFWAVGGYNERIATYGYDDDDLYNRLKKQGLSRTDLDNSSAHHTFTPDETRTIFQPEVKDYRAEVQKNRIMSTKAPWDADAERKQWYYEKKKKISRNLRYYEVTLR